MVFHIDDVPDIIPFRYVLSIENPEDREEYLREMLDANSSKAFFAELKSKDVKRLPQVAAISKKDQEMFSYQKPGNQEPQALGGARPKSGANQKTKQQVAFWCNFCFVDKFLWVRGLIHNGMLRHSLATLEGE